MELQIDREFKNLIPQLSPTEFDQLRDNVLAEGIRDALVTWRGILVDGHNRYTIATDYDLPFRTVELDLPDKDAVRLWIVKNQLGRRNLTPQQSSYLRGKWYNEENLGHGGDRKSKGQNVTLISTAQRIAEQTGVTDRTVKRDARFADNVDAIAEALGDEASASILSAETRLTKKEVEELVQLAQDAPQEAAAVIAGEKRPHVSNNSGNNEWYTPAQYIEAARAAMGGIDLDPASSEIANETVKADKFYTAEDNGLDKEWSGRVWMNPPYSHPHISQFCTKLVESDNVSEACVMVNNATETGWFNILMEKAACVCLIKGRVKFNAEDGEPRYTPLQGQIVLYFGDNTDNFASWFSGFGKVLYAR